MVVILDRIEKAKEKYRRKTTGKAWKAGVDGTSAEDFDEAVKGKEEKWFRRYKEVMGLD